MAFSQNNDQKLFEHSEYHFSYQLDKPDKYWELPKGLDEISGLSYIDDYRLACVQDEKGDIFIFNLKVGEIERKIEFGDDGDYEGIEIIENDAWVLKSTGTLYKVSDYLKKTKRQVIKYSTALSAKNDTEGLAYDHLNKNLLIACKGHPFLDDKSGKGLKSIYSFNIETKKFNKEPVLTISLDTIKKYKNYNTITRLGLELMGYFDSDKGDVSFQPSAIAIHPISGDIFVLASVGKLLLVYSRSDDILAIIKLNSKILPQPEGICFSPNGTLFISNEENGNNAKIVMFEMKK